MIDKYEELKLKIFLITELKNKVTTKKDLIDIFLKEQEKRKNFCLKMTVKELMEIAIKNGYKVKGYKQHDQKHVIETRKKLQEMYNKYTIKEISKKICRSRSRVYQLFEKYNIKLTKRAKTS